MCAGRYRALYGVNTMAVGQLIGATGTVRSAEEALLERLRSISGVDVTSRTSEDDGRCVLEVSVFDNEAIEMAVYRVERDIRQLNPTARFEVHVR